MKEMNAIDQIIYITLHFFYNTDEMFTTMEPVLKQLTILDTLIKLEDAELYDFTSE